MNVEEGEEEKISVIVWIWEYVLKKETWKKKLITGNKYKL